MPEFRIFYVNPRSDHITGSHDFSADDDLDAIRRAEGFRTQAAMELWAGDRRIKRWDVEEGQPAIDRP